MNQVVVESMQWNSLRHIADVDPIGDRDAACLEEVRGVLMKHGQVERLGLCLLHSHFDVAGDEILLETTNVERREHWVRPVKKAELEAAGITAQSTVIGFDAKGHRQICGCDPRSTGHHHK